MSTGKDRGKTQFNPLLVNLRQGIPGNPLQFLVHINEGRAIVDALRGDIHTVPSQTQHLAHPQGAGKRQVQCQTKHIVLAEVDGFEQGLCVPDFPLLLFVLGKGCVLDRIAGHQLPLDRLIEGTAEDFVNLSNRVGGDELGLASLVRPLLGFHGLELLIKAVHHAGGDIIQLRFPKQGEDVVVDQPPVALIGRGGPGVRAVDGDVFLQQMGQCGGGGGDECSFRQLMLHLGLPLLRLRVGIKALPLLTAFSVLVCDPVGHRILALSLDDACHYAVPPCSICSALC